MRVFQKALQSCAHLHTPLLLVGAACAVSLGSAPVVPASAATPARIAQQSGQAGSTTDQSGASASLVGCVVAANAGERSATFSGEMTAVPGTTRMAMRIELLERAPGETGFHVVIAPGVGVWRAADSGVKVYKYLKQVTNLSAPAVYRAAVVFRWLGAHGHPLKRVEHLTRFCHQPLPPTPTPETPSGTETTTPPASGTTPGTSGASGMGTGTGTTS